jgi:hypothetical protein
MNDIKELLNFVTLVSGDNLGTFGKVLGDKKLKLFKLAEMVKHPTAQEKDAAKLLYGNIENTTNYRKLKSRLRNRLIDVIFLSNTERLLKFPYDVSLFTSQRNLLAAQILLMQDKRRTAVNLSKSALNLSLRHQHTQLIVIACRLLCHHFALSGLKKEFQYYSILLDKHLTLLKYEIEIILLHDTTLVSISGTAENNKDTKLHLKKCYKRACTLYKTNQSHTLILNYYRISIRNFHSRHQFEKVISLCKNCIQYLEKNPHLYQRSRAGEFALFEMDACLRLQKYAKGKECAERCERHFTPFNSPWLVFNEFYFLLAMRTENYPEALKIFYSTTSSNRFRKLSSIKIELWKIYEAWLNFSLPDSLPKKQFNLFRFLNEVSTVSKDKSGYNYSILIAQILLLLNIDNKDKLFELEIAFRLYFNRHIKKIKHPRHYYFGVMLRILFNCDFNSNIAEIKAKPYLKKLERRNLTAQTLEETEIIPYPILWNLILERCK